MQAIFSFFQYFVASWILLIAFIVLYVKVTPYNEFELIHKNNLAAAISLSGACIGFVMPLAASIYFTHSFFQMLIWAVITGATQIGVFAMMRRHARSIEEGHTAPALLLAALSICAGFLNAACVS